MNKISTLIAAATLAIIPLTGANAEYEDPKYYGFAAQSTVPAQRDVASQRIIPAHGNAAKAQSNQKTVKPFFFDGENASD